MDKTLTEQREIKEEALSLSKERDAKGADARVAEMSAEFDVRAEEIY